MLHCGNEVGCVELAPMTIERLLKVTSMTRGAAMVDNHHAHATTYPICNTCHERDLPLIGWPAMHPHNEWLLRCFAAHR